MSCWHGWHGCGPWPAPPGPWVGYGSPDYEDDWYEDVAWPARHRRRRDRAADPGLATASLEERLEELQSELRRMETALAELRRPGGEASAE